MVRMLDFYEGVFGLNGVGEVLKVIICVYCVIVIIYFKQFFIFECIQYSVNMIFVCKI